MIPVHYTTIIIALQLWGLAVVVSLNKTVLELSNLEQLDVNQEVVALVQAPSVANLFKLSITDVSYKSNGNGCKIIFRNMMDFYHLLQDIFEDYLVGHSNSKFHGSSYHLLENNCNNFR